MSEPNEPTAAAPPQEQDQLLKLQLAVTDLVLGYWKYGLYALGALLAAALAYGVTTSWLQSRAEGEFGAIARIDFMMPKPDQMAMYGLAPKDDPTDQKRMSDLAEGARRYTEVAQRAHGPAAVLAWLRAADAYERSGKADERLAALKAGSDLGADQLPGFTADSAYAAALREAGRADEALALYAAMAERHVGFAGEQSLLMLAGAQADAGRTAEARTTLSTFATRFPQSPSAGEAAALSLRIGTTP